MCGLRTAFASIASSWFCHLRRRRQLSLQQLLPTYAPSARALFTPPPLSQQLLLRQPFCRAAAGALSQAFNLTIFIMMTTANDYFCGQYMSVAHKMLLRCYFHAFGTIHLGVKQLPRGVCARSQPLSALVEQVLSQAVSREFSMQIMRVRVCVSLFKWEYKLIIYACTWIWCSAVVTERAA